MNEADYIARIRYWITQRERDPERTYTSAELLDACDLLRDYDALAARLAEADKLILRMSGEGFQRARFYVEKYDLTGERAADSATGGL